MHERRSAVLVCGSGAVGCQLERKTGIEPATFSLARRCSTTELLPPARRAAAHKR